MSLFEAIKSVRQEVEAGESLADAIAFVADESGLNPELLARKVNESYGANVAAAVPVGVLPPQALKKVRVPREADFDADLAELSKLLGVELDDVVPGYRALLYPALYGAAKQFDPTLSPEAFGKGLRGVSARKLGKAERQLAAFAPAERAALLNRAKANAGY